MENVNTQSILETVLQAEQDKVGRQFHPALIVKALFDCISPRECEVLQRRYGLHNAEAETLEAIGKLFHVTRERIRQIENAAIRNLHHIKEFETMVDPAKQIIIHTMQSHGGAMSEQHLAKEVLEDISNIHEMAALCFMLERILSDHIIGIEQEGRFKKGWRMPHISEDRIIGFFDNLSELFTAAEEPIPLEEVLKQVSSLHSVSEKEILAHLYLGQEFHYNPFGEWGISTWATIRPRRMADKIYLILKKHQEPMHFKDLADHINNYQFDHKKAHPPTVHNELILDKRFVLVGRGMYALREWGYQPGVVAEVIDRVFEKEQKPLTREEIIFGVMKERVVKPGTVYLALTDKSKYTKNADGTFIRTGF